MPTKKKTSKKSRSKKPVAKRPAVKPVETVANKPAAEPIAAKSRPGWEVWTLVIVILLSLTTIYIVSRPDTSSDQPQSSDNSTSGLHVVPEAQGGASSNQASGALQPQATGLQQAKPSTQSASGLNLQAQTTPNQSTAR